MNWFETKFSKFILSIIAIIIFLLGSVFITAYPRKQSTSPENFEAFVSDKIVEWKKTYGSEKSLKIARIDINFNASPKNFVKGEGAVIAPIGLDLPGFQKIVEVASYPQAIRELPVDGIKALAWPYTGECRDNYHYVALSLVRQTPKEAIKSTETPSYVTLPRSFAADATARAIDLEEHSLHECSVFSYWAKDIAGSGSYIDKFKRITKKVSNSIIDDKKKFKRKDDICASIRHNRFTIHRAHVVIVMACRENGIPCYAFSAAVEKACHLVGIFSDQTGWIFFDLDKPERGFFSDPPVLLTLSPLNSSFAASRHDYWYPGAAAYRSKAWGISPFSYTAWGTENNEKDVTVARTLNIDGVKNEKQ